MSYLDIVLTYIKHRKDRYDESTTEALEAAIHQHDLNADEVSIIKRALQIEG
jgi:hypothetical protein